MNRIGLEQDLLKAVQLLNDTLKHGMSSLTVDLGQYYENGFCVEQDLEKAVEYYKMGTDQTCST